MLDLITGGTGTLAMIGAAIVAVIAVLWKVFRAGRAIERGKTAQQANKGWVDANDLQGRAADARRDARRGANVDVLSDDGFKRPKP